jgi:hypothetical protein
MVVDDEGVDVVRISGTWALEATTTSFYRRSFELPTGKIKARCASVTIAITQSS